MKKIGIITVLYNSEKVLKDFFDSLNMQTFKNFTLYIVDNKSPDKSLELAEKLSKNADFSSVIIKNEANFGVAKGNNIGIKQALKDGCKYILLSNNDITLEQNTIEKLFNDAIKNKAMISIPKIYYWGTNKIWCAGGNFTKLTGCTKHIGVLEEDVGQFDKPRKTEYAPTCFMLINCDVFHLVGLMDERYFVYFDDTDFIFRVNSKKIKIWYFPDSIVWHKESVSTGKGSPFSAYYFSRNILLFNRKNRNILFAYFILFQHFFLLLISNDRVKNRETWLAAWRGLRDGMKFLIRKI